MVHGVQAGGFALQEGGGGQRPLRVDGGIPGLVPQGDDLGAGVQQHLVNTGGIAQTEGMDADLPGRASAAVPPSHQRDRIGPNLPHRPGQHQGGAAGDIGLGGVVVLHDLDVRVGEKSGRLPHQTEEQRDARRDIAGEKQRELLRGGADDGPLLFGVAGGADDRRGASGDGPVQQRPHRFMAGNVDDAVSLPLKGGQGGEDALPADEGIHPSRKGAAPAVFVQHGGQRPAHAAAGAVDQNIHGPTPFFLQLMRAGAEIVGQNLSFRFSAECDIIIRREKEVGMMRYTKPSKFYYRLAQVVSWFVATFIFRRKILRNEIKGVEGPYVVIANHQAAYDFVNLIGTNRRPMTFVISSSFYNSLPVKGILTKLGVIPKQQFQTSVRDMKKMKAVVDQGQPLVIYPAGLMCEDGLSTPIPEATYKFLKWLGVDVYMARTSGAYFVMPKWAGGMRAGRTCLDIYRLFSKEELAELDVESVKKKTDEAILFDAYREQEKLQVRYRNGHIVEGLENVLYMCPHCGEEFTVTARENRLTCTACGYEQESDEYAFLHNRKGLGKELRYVSDWSRLIYESLREKVKNGEENGLSVTAKLHMIDSRKNKFVEVGEGEVSLSREGIRLVGTVGGEPMELQVPIANTPTLPFGPGRYLEVQQGEDIYRCVPADGRPVMKFINLVKIFHELSREETGIKTAK